MTLIKPEDLKPCLLPALESHEIAQQSEVGCYCPVELRQNQDNPVETVCRQGQELGTRYLPHQPKEKSSIHGLLLIALA